MINQKFQIIIFNLLVFIFFAFNAISQDITVVEASGVGLNRNDALQDALRNAVGQAVGVALQSEFTEGKKSVQNQSFAETQMKVAKQFTKNNCLSVAQIKEIMGVFSFKENKPEYAKYAYDYFVNKKIIIK